VSQAGGGVAGQLGGIVDRAIARRTGARDAEPRLPGRVDEFLRSRSDARGELAPMLQVALAAKRAAPTTELVWTGPSTPVVPVRRTEQVLCDLIRSAERRLTMTSFGIFQVPRLIEELEQALARGVAYASCWATGNPTALRSSTASVSNWGGWWPPGHRCCSGCRSVVLGMIRAIPFRQRI